MVRSLARLVDQRFQPPGVPALRPETVLSAIDAANDGDASPPVLRFHQDSNLLFVRGTMSQWQLVEEVLEAMLVDRDGLREVAPSRPATPAEPAAKPKEPTAAPAPSSLPAVKK